LKELSEVQGTEEQKGKKDECNKTNQESQSTYCDLKRTKHAKFRAIAYVLVSYSQKRE